MSKKPKNVQGPLKNRYEIITVLKRLEEEQDPYLFLLITFGLHSCVLFRSILEIKVKDMLDEDLRVRKTISIKDRAHREATIHVNSNLRRAIEKYFIAYPQYAEKNDNYVFFQRVGRSNKPAVSKHATTGSMYTKINSVFEQHGIKNVSWLTLQKTYGYHLYKQGLSLNRLKSIFKKRGSFSRLFAFLELDIDETTDEKILSSFNIV